MNGGKSDASTSTDDVKDRPLCLFYFTHPFGVLSPEPPTFAAAPPAVARAFLNMEPLESFFWPSSASGAPSAPPREPPAGARGAGAVRYDLGAARVHQSPVSVARARRYTLPLRPPPPDSSLSSSLLSSDVWFPSSSGGCSREYPRRAPYARMLPPLRLPSPKDVADYSSDDVWPRRCLGKFSLPPIEMPPQRATLSRRGRDESPGGGEEGGGAGGGGAREVKCARKVGVKKQRRGGRGGRAGDVRRMVTRLMRRTIRGEGPAAEARPAGSPALQRALAAIREAWAAPASLRTRGRVLSRMYARNSALEQDNIERDSERESEISAMLTRTQLVELPSRADVSPGLMRRRYSVPETIMRKYRLAQQSSDSEDGASARATHGEGGSSTREAARSAGESPQRRLRRDRELMRKSALLRRMWARPPPPAAPSLACRCEDPTADPSDWILASRERAPSSSCLDTVDACSEGSRAASPPAPPLPPPRTDTSFSSDGSPPPARLYEESDSFSASLSTAKETPGSRECARSGLVSTEGRVSGRESPRGVSDGHDTLSAERAPASFELLEIVVSESTSSPPECRAWGPARAAAARGPRAVDVDLDVDEYVSRVLVESLASLSERLEGMPASGNERRLSIVEKEIKVRLQNAGVNTVVHLSPTSNNQIIFGNEELCDDGFAETSRSADARSEDLRNERFGQEARDECNNLPPPLPYQSSENNNNRPPLTPSPPPPQSDAEVFDALLLRHDNVNGAVLRQIQKLFRDELRLSEEMSLRGESVSHIEISNVDVYLGEAGADGGGGGGDAISVGTRARDEPLADVGAGNYYRDARGAALVPRRLAVPHSASMEVNTSSSEDGDLDPDPLGSDATSLVDSLDDPDSPRPRPRPRPHLARSAVDVLALLPEEARPAPPEPATAPRRDRAEAFFIGIREDAPTPTPPPARVAECMPERIRQKLHRRHRRREQRAECARRGKVRRLRDELERRRRDELERECAALVDALLDEVIARVARVELEAARRRRPAPPAEEGLGRRRGDQRPPRRADRHQHRSRPGAPPETAPAPVPPERGPRRIYQKSEIREGDKCIEILEILEYAGGSRSSPETTPSDEGGGRARRSRIPVPVGDRAPARDHMRLTGGDARAYPPIDLLLGAFASACVAPPPPPPQPPPPRSRSNSLRFRRVFDMIPEERSSLSFESPSPETAEPPDAARRASAPDAGVAPPAAAPPAPAPARASTRSAATSPPRSPRRVRSRTTMTSPVRRSAATSPLPPPPPRPLRAAPAPTREGSRAGRDPPRPERRVARRERLSRGEGEITGARRSSPAGDRSGGSVGSGATEEESSESADSGGSLLCSLAPRWLSGHTRRRRSHRGPVTPPLPPAASPPQDARPAGGWSVTVAGSCRAALPADVEMRLRFPRAPAARAAGDDAHRECECPSCVAPQPRARGRAPPPRPAAPALPPARPSSRHDRLTLAMKKEAQDAAARRSAEQLPGLEACAGRARSKLRSSVKTRRGYSLHCWLPDDEPAPLRASNGLSVLGCAIIPELKPRVPTMSERDLTRVYTPRHYLRS